MIACHECDLLHEYQPLADGEKAHCSRCGASLYKYTANSCERSLALFLSALFCFVLANTFPFLSLEFGGRLEENILLSGAIALYRFGMGELGLLVFLTSIAFPMIVISGMVYILASIQLGKTPAGMHRIYRLVRALIPWSLLGVFMLGVLLSIVKLQDMANIIPGISLFSFVALMFFYSAALAGFDPQLIWPHVHHSGKRATATKTARESNLVSCHDCNLLMDTPDQHHARCPRCDAPLHSRKQNSSTRTWALMATASLLLIPANLYPIMTVIRFGQGEPSTIFGGITKLIEAQMWPLAMIVLFASIIVPLAKLGVLGLLLETTRKGSNWRTQDRSLLYRVTEMVGAWSMVDIYLIAILSALVNLDALSTIAPGPGAQFFAAAVIITMFAAHSFDPRTIWDRATEPAANLRQNHAS